MSLCMLRRVQGDGKGGAGAACIRVLKHRLGDDAGPEGPDEPFRARALVEPAL